MTRDQVVARTDLPGPITSLNVVNRLSITPAELPKYTLKQEGDAVEAGEPLVETQPFIKWFKTVIPAPVTGTVESVSTVTGQILLREAPTPVEVRAYVDGEVEAVIPGQGVDLLTTGPYIQGIFGVGGERWGTLKVVGEPSDALTETIALPQDCTDLVLVSGGGVSHGYIEAARERGAVGIVAACTRDGDLRQLLGYDLGVAITGTEPIGISLIITEGFGPIRMAAGTFAILKENDGAPCSVSGATQIRAGVQRPEVIVAAERASEDTPTAASSGLAVDASVRGIRDPYFGKIGSITDLPTDLVVVESGARVRVVEVTFDDGTSATVPRANVEKIET